MNMKKIICSILSVGMMLGAIQANTYAASQLVMQKTEQELFSSSFAGTDAEKVAADYTLDGTWNYGEESIYQQNNSYKANGSLMTNASYDLTDKKYWEFEVVTKNQSNGYEIKFGSYYLVRIYRTNDYGTTVKLFKAGEELISQTMSDTWDTKLTFTVIYNRDVLTLKRGKTAVFSYDKIDSTLLSGQFGVKAVSANRFDLYSMKLTANTPVDYWVYEEDFDNETVDSLTEKGWVLQNEATIVSAADSYLSSTKKAYTASEASYSPYGNLISGNYGIYARQQIGSNSNSGYIKISSADGSYYGFYPVAEQRGTQARLVKYDAESKTTTVLDTDVSSYIYDVIYTYDIKVYTNDGETKLIADIYLNNQQTPVHLEAVDTEKPITSGNIKIYWGATENRRLYDFSVYSIVGENEKPEATMKDKTVFSKVFSASDSYATLVNDNIAVESSARNKGIMSWYDVTEYATFTDENGMRMDIGHVYYTYDKTNEDYTFNANMYRRYNESGIRFNCSDTRDTYYQFETSSRGTVKRGFTLNKVTPSGTTTLASLALPQSEYGVKSYSATGAELFADYKITCDYQEDGSLDITVKFKAKGQAEYVFTAKDESPLTGNRIEMLLGDQGKIKSFSITKPEVYYGLDGDKPVFEVRLCNEAGKVMTSLQPGMIYANTFAMLLEDYKAVAAIYDGSTLTDIKVINAADLYESNVELFEAAEGNTVKVFIWNSLSGMIPIINATVAK